MLVALVMASFGAPMVLATTTSNSDNFQATEMQFGSGGSLESCSDEYCARASIGDIATGGATSTGETSAEFGSITADEPMLEVIVDPGESDLGILTTERTASKSMIVRVRNYLSTGYTLSITGDAPKYEDHSLATSSNPTASVQGTEQFGINAAPNTTPQIGAAAVQVPTVETSFGSVRSDYNMPNLFKYQSGDIVASSNRESGRTDYTISMIVNVSNSTPAGKFTGDYSAVVVPVY